MQTIDLCMIAWPRDAARLEYMEKSLASFRDYVHASRHKLDIYVSSETLDVSTENFLAARAICEKYSARIFWRNMPPSLGGNMNDVLMMGHGDFKLLTQDDWAWNRKIDLSVDADMLTKNHEFAFIRYATFYTEFTGFDLAFVAQYLENPEFQIYHFVDMEKPYCYGDQPHLRRADFSTRLSATGGLPIGFYKNTESGDYAGPEHAMAAHLVANYWKIAAYNPNVVDHVGSLSSCPTRRNAG